VVVDLPEDCPGAIDIESSEIVVALRIIVLGEAVESRDLAPDANLGFRGGRAAMPDVQAIRPGTGRGPKEGMKNADRKRSLRVAISVVF
jgi:hypothetical protein